AVICDRLQKTFYGLAMMVMNQSLLHEPELVSQPLYPETEIRFFSAGLAETFVEQTRLDQRLTAKTRVCCYQVRYDASFVGLRVQQPARVNISPRHPPNGASASATDPGHSLMIEPAG